MSREFSTLSEYLKDLKNRYFFTLSAFYTYEGLRECCAPNIVGENEVNLNLEQINRFKNFFLPCKEALRVYFLLELAKLFDISKESLCINKIVNFTESNIRNLSLSDFSEFNKDKRFLSELIENYRSISIDDLRNVKSLISKYKDTIDDLKTYRDECLAHDDLKKFDIENLNQENIKNLFFIIEKILNLFSRKIDSSTSIYDYVERLSKDDLNNILDYLRRFEPYRLREIKELYNEELKGNE